MDKHLTQILEHAERYRSEESLAKFLWLAHREGLNYWALEKCRNLFSQFDTPLIRFRLANASAAIGNFSEALRLHQENILDKNSGSYTAGRSSLNMGIIWSRLEEPIKAQRAIEEGLSIMNSRPRSSMMIEDKYHVGIAKIHLAEIKLYGSNPEQALADLRRLRNSEDVETASWAGIHLLRHKGKPSDQKEFLELLKQLSVPGRGFGIIHYAKYLISHGRTQDAIDVVRKEFVTQLALSRQFVASRLLELNSELELDPEKQKQLKLDLIKHFQLSGALSTESSLKNRINLLASELGVRDPTLAIPDFSQLSWAQFEILIHELLGGKSLKVEKMPQGKRSIDLIAVQRRALPSGKEIVENWAVQCKRRMDPLKIRDIPRFEDLREAKCNGLILVALKGLSIHAQDQVSIMMVQGINVDIWTETTLIQLLRQYPQAWSVAMAAS